MAVPPSVTTRVVRGTYVNSGGTPQSGTVTFRVDQPLIATVESWGIVPTPTMVILDADGSFQVSLMASSDLDLFPSGFYTIVQERFQGGYVRTYRIAIPSGSTPLDLPTATQYDPGDVGLAVVHSVNGMTGIVQLGPADFNAVPLSQKGAANGVATLNSSALIPTAQIPGLAASQTTSGVFTLARIPTGSTGSTVALGDHTHAFVPSAVVGTPEGVAPLDSNGDLPAANLTPYTLRGTVLAADAAIPGDLPAGALVFRYSYDVEA